MKRITIDWDDTWMHGAIMSLLVLAIFLVGWLSHAKSDQHLKEQAELHFYRAQAARLDAEVEAIIAGREFPTLAQQTRSRYGNTGSN